MNIIAINGSPRKEWNTGTMLKKTLEGAASKGAKHEFIHLYDLSYKGCISCFACKEKNGKSYGRCVLQDDLAPLIKKIEGADAVIFGSPVYLGNMTGEMQSFLERLIFPYLTYADPPKSLFPKKIPTAFIYTMGVNEELFEKFAYAQRLANTERLLAMIFGLSETLFSLDTYQFSDYSKVVAPRFNPEQKLKRRAETFPKDCRKAYDLGVRFATK
jgi:multimeric flavodoxin WrbA